MAPPPQYANASIILFNSFAEAQSLKQPLGERKRKCLPGSSTGRILREWFKEHSHHPYPIDSEVENLADRCDVTTTQVRKWIDNKLARKEQKDKYLIWAHFYPYVTKLVCMCVIIIAVLTLYLY